MKKNELTKFQEIIKGIDDILFGLKKKSPKKMKNNMPTDMYMICYELDYKFTKLLKICNQITDNSNPAFVKKQIDEFKQEYEL